MRWRAGARAHTRTHHAGRMNVDRASAQGMLGVHTASVYPPVLTARADDCASRHARRTVEP